MADDPLQALQANITVSSREGVIKVFEEHLDRFEEIIDKEYPGAYNPLNGNVYIRWERKLMMWLGRVSGELAMLQVLQVVRPEEGQKLKERALSMINRATAKAMMEGRRQ